MVIVFNDAELLPKAVASVLDQTLSGLEVIVVDDASTDGSGEVADRLASADDRVRVIHLPVNSGGCSAPRNAGLDAARAPYVMFLDSDDTYERHACKNLLLEAERSDADVVAGKCVRVYLDLGKELVWAPQVFEQRVTYASIRENPELFFDAISTNKIYRRAFLEEHNIRFPEGLHYEDQLFVAKVYCLARTISIIPNLVYIWRVLRSEPAALSISSRRSEIDNFRHRIGVHRLIDAWLLDNGMADLKVHKDVKFVRHDLRLYLSDLLAQDEAYQREFVDLAADYLAGISAESLRLIDPIQRVCVHLIRNRDVGETLRALRWVKQGFKVATDLVERDGRIYWSAKYLGTEADRELSDVTELGLHRIPFSQQSLYNEVTRFAIEGSVIRLAGSLINQLGQIKPDDPLRLTVTVKRRQAGRRITFPVRAVHHDGRRITYEADVDLARAFSGSDLSRREWDISLEIRWNDRVNRAPLSVAPEVAGRQIVVTGDRRSGSATLQTYVTINGNLALEEVPAATEGRRDPRLRVVRLLRGKAAAVRRRLRTAANSKRLKVQVYLWLARLPVQPGLAVFESHQGRQYSDSPKYIHRELVSQGKSVKPVWVYAKSKAGFPADTTLVRRGSWAYYRYLARAQYWVDNQGFPRQVTKRGGTTYVQTWHGTPLKKMGFDEPKLEQAEPAEQQAHRDMIARWDLLLVPSEYFVDTFVRSYRYDGPLLRCGLPRNDPLVRPPSVEDIAARKRALDLPTDRRLVLYAPTFRRPAANRKPLTDLLDLQAMQRELSDEFFLVVRAHYLDDVKVSRRHAAFARDLSGHHDITELLLLTDVLVTDYSSVMFDFANAGRPMVFFTPDYEDYVRDERGTYLELTDIAPGPIVHDSAGLIQALKSADDHHRMQSERYEQFRQRFCTYEAGTAAASVVREVFGETGGRRG